MLKKFWDSFHSSEVIWWSRVQVAVGAIWLGFSQTDLSPIIRDPKWLTYWLIFNGIVTELFRRHRGEYDDDGKMR